MPAAPSGSKKPSWARPRSFFKKGRWISLAAKSSRTVYLRTSKWREEGKRLGGSADCERHQATNKPTTQPKPHYYNHCRNNNNKNKNNNNNNSRSSKRNE